MASKYTNSSKIRADGKILELSAWAQQLGCPVQTLISRLDRGWDPVRAVTEKPTAGPANRGIKVAAEILVGDEVDRVLAGSRNSKTAVRDRAMIVVSYRAGLRCCELLRLKPKDIDQAAKTIRILHGKGDKARVVGIDAKAWEILQTWIRERDQFAITSDSPLFCTREGKPIASRQVRAMMNRRGKNAGLEKHVHLHGLRHTMASEMAAEGVALLDICGALGHANASTTNRYLQQLNPTSVLDAMRSRSWGAGTQPRADVSKCTNPAPGWLERLRADIGDDRLLLFHDARSDADRFRAVILLMD